MNRHGGILHWGVLLIMAGLIVFLGLSIKSSVTPGVKGEWVVTFLKEGYFEAQKVLLKNDIIAKNIGQEIAVELAANGGFPPETSSGCGRSKGRNFWNKEEQWCLPDVKNAVITQAQEKLALRLAGKTFTDIGYSSTFFFGKGSAETIKTNHGTYTFENGFSVDVGYSFAEYDQLTAEAQRLIKACRNKRNLQECVDGARNAGWKYASCDEEEFPSEGRQIPFCVVSSATQLSSPALYLFTLDFTPTEPFPIEDIEAKGVVNTNLFEISFPDDLSAESYTIYFTNDLRLLDYTGSAEDIIIFEAAGSFLEKVSFSREEILTAVEQCSQQEKGNAYLCDGRIFYLLESVYLEEGGDYAFSATAIKKGKESSIGQFVLNS